MVAINFQDSRLPDRFWARCTPEPNSGCWLWFGAHNPEGYGRIRLDGKQWLAHRLAFLTLVGSLIPGMELDHRVCQNPSCCNPAHLEQVSQYENWHRGNTPSRKAARDGKCKHGHPFDEKNGHMRMYRGKLLRVCRRCRNMNKAKAMAKRRRRST